MVADTPGAALEKQQTTHDTERRRAPGLRSCDAAKKSPEPDGAGLESTY